MIKYNLALSTVLALTACDLVKPGGTKASNLACASDPKASYYSQAQDMSLKVEGCSFEIARNADGCVVKGTWGEPVGQEGYVSYMRYTIHDVSEECDDFALRGPYEATETTQGIFLSCMNMGIDSSFRKLDPEDQ